MLQPNLPCIKCVGDNFQCLKCNSICIKHGKTLSGKQRYRCKQCGKTALETYTYKAYYSSTSKNIVHLLREGSGIRSIARLLCISTSTVIKKILITAGQIHKPYVPMNKTYEMDEMKTYVLCKRRQLWIAYAIEKQTRRVVDFSIGYRNNRTLLRVISTLILADAKKIYTDGFKNYRFLIPATKHKVSPFGTNHIERMNLNLRTGLKRLQRKTICYSKSTKMLEACLKIWFWYLNSNPQVII